MPIHRQSHTNPCRSIANLIPSHANHILPSRFQTFTNPKPICQSQSDANLTTSCRSGTNPTQSWSTNEIPIMIQSTNLLPIHQFITSAASHQLSTNPGSTHRPTISCKSLDVGQIQKTEDTLIIHFSTQSATACQSHINPYGHRLALDRQRSCQSTTTPYGHCTQTWWN